MMPPYNPMPVSPGYASHQESVDKDQEILDLRLKVRFLRATPAHEREKLQDAIEEIQSLRSDIAEHRRYGQCTGPERLIVWDCG